MTSDNAAPPDALASGIEILNGVTLSAWGSISVTKMTKAHGKVPAWSQWEVYPEDDA